MVLGPGTSAGSCSSWDRWHRHHQSVENASSVLYKATKGRRINHRKNENAKMTSSFSLLPTLSINKAKSNYRVLQLKPTYYQLCPLTKQDVSTAETWDISEKSVLRWSARTVTCSATWPLTATVAPRQ